MQDILAKIKSKEVYRNLSVPRLVEDSLLNKEGILTNTGALLVKTGKYTGRSPKDKFIVDSKATHNVIAWGSVNAPVKRETFNAIKEEMIKFLNGKNIYVFDGFAGANKKYQRKFRIINEKASQNLFIRDLLIRPTKDELKKFGNPDWTCSTRI